MNLSRHIFRILFFLSHFLFNSYANETIEQWKEQTTREIEDIFIHYQFHSIGEKSPSHSWNQEYHQKIRTIHPNTFSPTGRLASYHLALEVPFMLQKHDKKYAVGAFYQLYWFKYLSWNLGLIYQNNGLKGKVGAKIDCYQSQKWNLFLAGQYRPTLWIKDSQNKSSLTRKGYILLGISFFLSPGKDQYMDLQVSAS